MVAEIVNFPAKPEKPEIVEYFHCAKCMDEKPDYVTPQEYTNYEVGLTMFGIQVWCKKHNIEVVYLNLVDFWTTMKFIHKVQGLPEMPPFELPKDEFPLKLIFSGSKGVYIDPDEYWHTTDGLPPENPAL